MKARGLRTNAKSAMRDHAGPGSTRYLEKTKGIELSHEEAIYLACHLRERTGVSNMEHLAQPEMYRRTRVQ